MIIFIHWVGLCLWLGGGITFMVWGPLARRTGVETWAFTWDTLGKVQRIVVAPGCAAATVTGIILSMQYAQRGFNMGALWLIVMQGLGLVAAILTLAVATPLANRMAFLAARSIEAGQVDPRAERVRGRLALVSSVAGALVLITLYFAAAKPA